MISMKRKKKSKKEMNKEMVVPMDMSEQYPYGLRFSLQNEEIKKLGLDIGKLKIEQTGMISAKVEIIEISSNESAGGNDQRRIELQITELETSFDKIKKKSNKFKSYKDDMDSMGGMAE